MAAAFYRWAGSRDFGCSMGTVKFLPLVAFFYSHFSRVSGLIPPIVCSTTYLSHIRGIGELFTNISRVWLEEALYFLACNLPSLHVFFTTEMMIGRTFVFISVDMIAFFAQREA